MYTIVAYFIGNNFMCLWKRRYSEQIHKCNIVYECCEMFKGALDNGFLALIKNYSLRNCWQFYGFCWR